MIYIFDDLERYKNFDFFDEIKDNEDIKFLKELPTSVEDDILSYFESLNAQAIFVHYSFKVSSQKNLHEIIKNWILQKNIYYIEFSGGLNTFLINDYYATIEVNNFYSNLLDYYRYFKTHNKHLLIILAYGKRYKLHYILNAYIKIKLRFLQDSNKPIDLLKFEKLIDDLIKIDELNEDKKELIQWIKIQKDISYLEIIYAIERWAYKYI